MALHVDAYRMDSYWKINPLRKWRWDDPQLPDQSTRFQQPFQLDDMIYTAPHRDNERDATCQDYLDEAMRLLNVGA